MSEANHLALRIIEHIGRRESTHLDFPYTEPHHFAWQGLSASECGTPRTEFDSIRRNIDAVLPSLPASGDDLDDLLLQLHKGST